MKTIIIGAAALAAFAIASPSFAQSESARTMTGYGSLGYSQFDAGSADVGAAMGRLGLRFGRYLGFEGEAGFGVRSDKDTLAGVPYRSKLKHAIAAYGVGYVPVSPKLDLFGRVGYGETKFSVASAGAKIRDGRTSWNYGGGAQYFLTDADGVRVDYTRQSFTHGPGHANVWGASYVRKF